MHVGMKDHEGSVSSEEQFIFFSVFLLVYLNVRPLTFIMSQIREKENEVELFC